jgi:hypothetical protein
MLRPALQVIGFPVTCSLTRAGRNSALSTDGYFVSAFATHSGANESRYRQNRNTQQIVASTAG